MQSISEGNYAGPIDHGASLYLHVCCYCTVVVAVVVGLYLRFLPILREAVVVLARQWRGHHTRPFYRSRSEKLRIYERRRTHNALRGGGRGEEVKVKEAVGVKRQSHGQDKTHIL